MWWGYVLKYEVMVDAVKCIRRSLKCVIFDDTHSIAS